MMTPGGFQMSVEMTNCGTFGWTTDKKGYRYESTDPLTGSNWSAMPAEFLKLARPLLLKVALETLLPTRAW
jgi:DNA oxidative demethylase